MKIHIAASLEMPKQSKNGYLGRFETHHIGVPTENHD